MTIWRVTIVLVSMVVAGATIITLAPYAAPTPVLAAIGAGLIYIFSHVLRAARLAVLSMSMLGLSGRTAALMHFATAPVSLVLPFKLGEIVRLYELWKMSGTAVYAIIVLLIDRMYDSLFLVPVLVFLVMQGNASPLLVAFSLLAAVVPLTVVVIGPKLLTEVQRYVVASHTNPRTIDVLRQIDSARLLVIRAADVSRRRAPELCVISLLIWLCELAVCLILVNVFSSLATATDSALDLLGGRLVASWWTIGADTLVQPALAITTIAILLPWPLALALYLVRRRKEPRRDSTRAHTNRRVLA